MRFHLFCFLLAMFCQSAPILADDAKLDFFERKVRPLLIAKCGECHSSDEPDGKLTLTTAAGIAKGGSLGAVVQPGKVEQSRLIQAIRYTSKPKMPPDAKLPAKEIAILEKWVRDGAVMPAKLVSTRNGDKNGKFQITDEDRQWWAFQPLSKNEIPNVENTDRVRTAVDRFILQKLESSGLTLSSGADRRTMIRRVSFDLIGLPPTIEEVDEFLQDDRPDAYERLVDRLLASPQYGERWGRHWLDIARYADTNGGGFDYVYPNAWRYRDYVVQAFNDDTPYDRFLTEQLAGDLMPIDCDQDEYVRRLTATGLLTLAPKGLGMQDKEQMVLDTVDDQIDVLGRSLMGLTLSCSRCHDHKFDPIATKDYYALAGIFRSTQFLSDTNKNPSYWPEQPLELPSVTDARKKYMTAKAANAKALADAKNKANSVIITREKKRFAEYLLAAAKIRMHSEQETAIVHWSFDDDDGDKVTATTGPAGILKNLANSNGIKPKRVEGRLGRAMRFSGKKDIVECQQRDAFNFGKNADFSVAFWIRAESGYAPATADTLISAEYQGAMWFVALRPGPFNGIYLRHYDGARTVDIKPATNQLPRLTDNAWHHIVFTSDRDGVGRIFIDGSKVGEVSIKAVSSVAKYNQSKSFRVGPSHNNFRGDVDDMAIWNRQLSPREITSIYAAANVENNPRNVAQIEMARTPKQTHSARYDYGSAAKQGLVVSIVRRFVGILTGAEGDPKAPFFLIALLAPEKQTELPRLIDQTIQQKSDAINKLLNNKKTNPFVSGDDFYELYDDATKKQIDGLNSKAIAIETKKVSAPTFAMIAFDASKPADLKIHIAGDRKNLGEVARRGFPQILTTKQSSIQKKQSGRLELARWLTSPEHPLTARVFVNRVWQWHFGEGLVQTPDNFGRLGERPSHPELLDWLARRLIASNWSVKDLHRRIVLSSTYRQSSSGNRGDEIDSGNRLLWRMNRRRLEGEALRDAMLAVSEKLDPHMGGTVNKWKAKMFSVDDANKETANYDTRRRSIYLPVVRGAALHEMLQLFDFGDPNSITSRRDVTTVAPQALFLMNSKFVIEQANKLSERIKNHSNDTMARVNFAYRLTLTRRPTNTEQRRAAEFLASGNWRLFSQTLLCLNEFAYVE